MVNGLIAYWLVNCSLKITIVASHIGTTAKLQIRERERASHLFLHAGYRIKEAYKKNSSQFLMTASVPLGTGVTGAIGCA